MSFTKPTDVRTWWCAPHCGPGTTDSAEECECGLSRFDCALGVTEKIKAGGVVEGSTDGTDTACFVSGFWCHSCGRFWANDSCMERYGPEYEAADGAELNLALGGKVSCVCGQELFLHKWDDR